MDIINIPSHVGRSTYKLLVEISKAILTDKIAAPEEKEYFINKIKDVIEFYDH